MTAPILLIAGMVVGAILTLLALDLYDRREALIASLVDANRQLKERAETFERNAAVAQEHMMDWRLKALNAQYALEALQRIHRDPIARHEVEVRLGAGVWDSLPLDELMRRAA